MHEYRRPQMPLEMRFAIPLTIGFSALVGLQDYPLLTSGIEVNGSHWHIPVMGLVSLVVWGSIYTTIRRQNPSFANTFAKTIGTGVAIGYSVGLSFSYMLT